MRKGDNQLLEEFRKNMGLKASLESFVSAQSDGNKALQILKPKKEK